MADALTNNGDFLGNGWAFPVSGISARIAMVADEDNIRQAIYLILSTSFGERLMMPEFGCGLYRLLFSPGNTTTLRMAEAEVTQSLRQWEPRITVDNVSAVMSTDQPTQMLISVDYTIKSRNSQQNLVYPFFLETST